MDYHNILKENNVDEEEIYKILACKSRDNSRTPMQWNDKDNSGFSTVDPWIPVGKSYKEINAENALKDKGSIFYHYKKLIDLRKKYDVVSNGTFKMILEEHDKVLAYTRQYKNTKLIVLNNFYNEDTQVLLPQDLLGDDCRILISNYEDSMDLNDKILLRPYESIVYIVEN